MSAENKQVTFGSGKREIPAQKASKWYPAEDEPINKKVRKTQKPTNLRSSLKPGAVLIILAGRFRGKRVVYLKPLSGGVLLVTGPFKLNGVPLRRVNSRYVIATSTIVDISGVDCLDKFNEAYFAKEKDAKRSKEEKFFEAGKGPEKKPVPEARKSDQKQVDDIIRKAITQTPHLSAYISSTFALSKGDRPHLMKF